MMVVMFLAENDFFRRAVEEIAPNRRRAWEKKKWGNHFIGAAACEKRLRKLFAFAFRENYFCTAVHHSSAGTLALFPAGHENAASWPVHF